MVTAVGSTDLNSLGRPLFFNFRHLTSLYKSIIVHSFYIFCFSIRHLCKHDMPFKKTRSVIVKLKLFTNI